MVLTRSGEPVVAGVTTQRLFGARDPTNVYVARFTSVGVVPRFVRGDADASGAVEISDAILVLRYLFLGSAAPPCLDAADSNGDGELKVTDPIHVLQWLFLSGSAPAPPAPCAALYLESCGAASCGASPAATPRLGCASFPPCQ